MINYMVFFKVEEFMVLRILRLKEKEMVLNQLSVVRAKLQIAISFLINLRWLIEDVEYVDEIGKQ